MYHLIQHRGEAAVVIASSEAHRDLLKRSERLKNAVVVNNTVLAKAYRHTKAGLVRNLSD